MVTALQPKSRIDRVPAIESALIKGDLKDLSPEERTQYYLSVCRSLGLNELTKPFQYITLSGRLTLYATKDCTEQLRNIRNVSVSITAREHVEGVYVVTARATLPDGRSDESIGAVSIEGLKGEALANAYMKAETKSKRRVTLSICGLGVLDETEIETIPDARVEQVEIVAADDLPFDADESPEPLTDADDWVAMDTARKAAGVMSKDFLAYIKTEHKADGVKSLTKSQAAAVIAHYDAELAGR